MHPVLSVFLETRLFHIAFGGQQNAFAGPVQICQTPAWDFQCLSLGRCLNAHRWGIPSSLVKRNNSIQLKKKQLNIYNLNPKSLIYLELSEFSMHIGLNEI